MEKKNTRIMEVNFNNKFATQYQELIESLLASGFDFNITEGQSEVWIYLPEPHGFSIVLDRGGKWRIE